MTYYTYRYPIEITDYQQLLIPGPATVLSVAQSRTDPNYSIDLWAVARPGQPERFVPVWIVGTGNPMPPQLEHGMPEFVGTVVCPNGLVWHVWTGN